MSSGRRRSKLWAASSLAVLLAAGGPTRPAPQSTISVTGARGQEGMGTFYGREAHGGPTASGERFNMYAMTAAHRTLPMGTRARVTNLRNGRSVVVRINDRGPYAK